MLWSAIVLPFGPAMMAGQLRLIRAAEEGTIADLKACRGTTIPIGEIWRLHGRHGGRRRSLGVQFPWMATER